MDAVMPVVSATVRHFGEGQAGHEGLDPAVRKALRRRARKKQTAAPRPGAQEGTMFRVGRHVMDHIECFHICDDVLEHLRRRAR